MNSKTRSLKNLFARKRPEQSKQDALIYKQFTIQPCPSNAAHGWTTEAIITLEKGDQVLTHRFVRADISFNRKDAIELTLHKARTMIDQMGEQLFSDR